MGKTTNRLLEAANLAVGGQRTEALEKVESLRAYHHAEADGYGAAKVIDQHFDELAELVRGLAIIGELTPRSIDAVSSFGERISSRIVALALGAKHVDSRTVIITDDRHTMAAPLYAETYQRLGETTWGDITVMGGLIGSTLKGVGSTLGRGGSDFTASIVGAGVGAKEIQIWTDVDGMLTCDPTVLPGGRRVKSLSFAEAAELAYFGAKVLHPSTVAPAIEKNIPVLILNSRRPQVPGTRITAEGPVTKDVAKSIACKKSITLVNIQSTRMLMAHGFLRRIFEIFDRHETPVDMIATSEVSVSLTIDNAAHLEAIATELREFAEVDIEQDKAVVCIVGDNLRWQPGVAHRVFRALDSVNVRMISQGASLRNLGLVVAQADLKQAVELLHKEFFTDVDPEVFE
jgi:aspartate kinase